MATKKYEVLHASGVNISGKKIFPKSCGGAGEFECEEGLVSPEWLKADYVVEIEEYRGRKTEPMALPPATETQTGEATGAGAASSAATDPKTDKSKSGMRGGA